MEKPQLDALLATLTEVEQLLHFPKVLGHVEKATKLIFSIARKPPTPAIGNLAMKVISEADTLRSSGDRTKLNHALWHLRLALQEVKSQPQTPKDA